MKIKRGYEEPDGASGTGRVVQAEEFALTHLRRDLATSAGLGLVLPLTVIGLALILK